MRITFDGSNAADLVAQLREFVDAFEMGTVVANYGEQKPGSVIITPKVESKVEVKKKPGRPPKEEVLLPKKEVITEQQQPPASSAQVFGAAHAITKEDLTVLMQKLLEKGGDQAGQQSQILVIRNIFKEFGIGKLGELDQKRYHEIKAKFEGELAK